MDQETTSFIAFTGVYGIRKYEDYSFIDNTVLSIVPPEMAGYL